MSVTADENARALLVVEKSKKDARVDTGRLRRSINKKVQRGIIVFREYFYGAENGNSQLEQNAKSMMGDIPYKIERFDESGEVVESVNRASSGRVYADERKKENRLSNAKLLMLKKREKLKKNKKEKS